MRPENQSLDDFSKAFPGTVLPVKILGSLWMGEKGGDKEFEITQKLGKWEMRISHERPRLGPCRE